MKSFTDIEQSRKLAEILPIESADMAWQKIYDENHMMSDYRVEIIPYRFYSGMGVPCWSLAALLNELPVSCDDGQHCLALINSNPNGDVEWLCCYEDCNGNLLHECYASNPGDACYEMALKLKEKGLL